MFSSVVKRLRQANRRRVQKRRIRRDSPSYQTWIDTNEQPCAPQDDGPLVSIIMPVYNTPRKFLQRVIDSVLGQTYARWELCICDDASSDPAIKPALEAFRTRDDRIKVVYRGQNGHISEATNSALALASGEWVAFLDHDDELSADALAWFVLALKRQPNARLIYSDEDKISPEGERFAPYFKPDFDPILLRAQNYVCHLTFMRRAEIADLGGLRTRYNGAQDHDLLLRYIRRLQPSEVVHIPRILYHWRAHPQSTAASPANKSYAATATLLALNDHLAHVHPGARADLEGQSIRVRYPVPADHPTIDIIIPTRNHLDLLRRCINSIETKSSYARYVITIVDNGSDDPETIDYLQNLQTSNNRVTVLRDDGAFNFSRLMNHAVSRSRSDYVLLLNNDTEVISPDWLEELLAYASMKDVGCVGAKLLYPDDTVQHVGVVTGLGGAAGHILLGSSREHGGYFGSSVYPRSVTAVTGACLMVRRSIYDKVGGMDEEHLRVAFNDIDLCLKVQSLGFRNVLTPWALLYHHESASRESDLSAAQIQRFQAEFAFLREKWGVTLDYDPYYNVNLTLDNGAMGLARVSRPWPDRASRSVDLPQLRTRERGTTGP